MNSLTRSFSAFMLTVGLFAGSTALASSAWVSVPSAPNSPDKVVVTGGNLPAWSGVTVVVKDPDGTKTELVKTIAADGNLMIEFLPSVPGSHTVQVYGQDGAEIGGGSFVYVK